MSQPEPPKPVQIVEVPKPLPLPDQLKPLPARTRLIRAAPSRAPRRDANKAARVEPTHDGYINAVQVYPFSDGALYQIYAAPGEVTDIALEAGEQLVGSGPVAAGDTVRWVIGDTESGSGTTKRIHILLKPTQTASPPIWSSTLTGAPIIWNCARWTRPIWRPSLSLTRKTNSSRCAPRTRPPRKPRRSLPAWMSTH